jgi:hypothetical protein
VDLSDLHSHVQQACAHAHSAQKDPKILQYVLPELQVLRDREAGLRARLQRAGVTRTLSLDDLAALLPFDGAIRPGGVFEGLVAGSGASTGTSAMAAPTAKMVGSAGLLCRASERSGLFSCLKFTLLICFVSFTERRTLLPCLSQPMPPCLIASDARAFDDEHARAKVAAVYPQGWEADLPSSTARVC